MNRSLHHYLNDLVGDCQQLIITADNARIPMEIVGTPCGEESIYSGYMSLMDTSCSSTGSSSRWDSEAGLIEAAKEKKSQRPRLPPRRQNSGSPPVSPVTDAPRVRQVSHHKTKKSIPKCLDDDEKDDVDCCRRRSASDTICLADAAKGMLRMPQRRPSTSSSGKSRRSSSDKQRLPRSRREKRGDDQQHNRNVSYILDEAIRELRIDQEMPSMQACS